MVQGERRTARVRVTVLSGLLLLCSGHAGVECSKGAADPAKIDAAGEWGQSSQGGSIKDFHDQWMLGTLATVASAVSRYRNCQESAKKSEVCAAIIRHSKKVHELQDWAEQQEGWESFVKAADLYESSHSFILMEEYGSALGTLEDFVVLKLFPNMSHGFQRRWHLSLFNLSAMFRRQRMELADAITLLAGCLLESGSHHVDLRLLLKARIALDLASGIRYIDEPNYAPDEYTMMLQGDIMESLRETIPKLSSGELRDTIHKVGLECEDCTNDFDYQRNVMSAAEFGFLMSVRKAQCNLDDSKQREKDREGLDDMGAMYDMGMDSERMCEPPTRQQLTLQVLQDLSMWLSNTLLGLAENSLLKELSPLCLQWNKKLPGSCSSYFPTDIVNDQGFHEAVKGEIHTINGRRARILTLAGLDSTEQSVAETLVELDSFEYKVRENFEQQFNNLRYFDLEEYSLLDGYFSEGENGAGESGVLGSGASNSASSAQRDRQEDSNKVNKPKLHGIPDFRSDVNSMLRYSSETKGDDPIIIPLTLLALAVICMSSWMGWKHKKHLSRYLNDIFSKRGAGDQKRLSSGDTEALRVAIASGDIEELAQAVEEVRQADPAVMRRARTLLAQKRKAKKDADAAKAKAKAKAAKARVNAVKKGGKMKKGDLVSAPVTVAAVRAKVEHTRSSNHSSIQEILSDSLEDVEFKPVVSSRKKVSMNSQPSETSSGEGASQQQSTMSSGTSQEVQRSMRKNSQNSSGNSRTVKRDSNRGSSRTPKPNNGSAKPRGAAYPFRNVGGHPHMDGMDVADARDYVINQNANSSKRAPRSVRQYNRDNKKGGGHYVSNYSHGNNTNKKNYPQGNRGRVPAAPAPRQSRSNDSSWSVYQMDAISSLSMKVGGMSAGGNQQPVAFGRQAAPASYTTTPSHHQQPVASPLPPSRDMMKWGDAGWIQAQQQFPEVEEHSTSGGHNHSDVNVEWLPTIIQ